MSPRRPAATRAAPALAWSLAGLAVATAVTAVAVGADAGSMPWKLVLLPLVWAVPGVLLAAGSVRNPVGWLMLAMATLFAASAFATQWVETGHETGAAWATWVADRSSAYVVPCGLLVLLLLPDGRLPARGWRLVAVPVVAAQLLLVTGWSLLSGPAAAPDSSLPASVRDLPNPAGVLPRGLGDVLENLDLWLLQAPMLLGLAAVVVRLRRHRGDERQRLVGLLVAVAVFALLVVIGRQLWPAAASALDVLGSALVAAALTAAVLRRRLPGVDVVLNHALVYSLLTAAIAGGYVGIVVLAGAVGDTLSSYGVGVVTALLALLLLPARSRLQRLVDRMMRGDSHDPGGAVRRLSGQLEDATTLDALVSGLARATRSSLRASSVRVVVDATTTSDGVPQPGGATTSVPLVSGASTLGTMTVELPAGRRLRPVDRRLLADLADHGARAIHAARLADALAASRHLIVTAREEERSRLRRDLHDELGPTLAGLAMQLAGMEELLRSDPASAAQRLPRLEAAALSALEDVRRVSRGLRPPALDELGLTGALGDLAQQLGLRATWHLDELPTVSPAVEVAVYRIAAEALTNVARHSGTRRVEVSLHHDDAELVVAVRDDGNGGAGRPTGVGMLAMRERAEELGGSLDTRAGLDGGLVVEARLPLASGVST